MISVLLMSVWYCSPYSTSGDGSSGNPWNLSTALQSPLVHGGDVIYLRSGNFLGPFISTISGTSNAYVTVQSYPGEWAVISDGAAGGLLTTLGSGGGDVGNVKISGSEYWPLGGVVIIGTEQLQLFSKTATNWSMARGWNGTAIASHAIGSSVILIGSIIEHTGSYVAFKDFEMTSVYTTNRVVTASHALGAGLNIPNTGTGNKAINLVIHNTGHPAIGFWNQGDGGEINGCVVWGTGQYDFATRGTAIYAQNQTGTVLIKNNISFRNFTEGMQAYGTHFAVNGFRFINNITMMNPNGYGIAVWNQEVPMTNNATWTNYHGLDDEIWGYTSASNISMSMLGNVVVKPPSTIVQYVRQHTSGEVQWNTRIFDGHGLNLGALIFEYPTYALSNMSFVFDNNAYYIANNSADMFGLSTLDHPSSGVGKRTFFQWKSETGFDANSTQTSIPSTFYRVAIHQYDYDANRWNICVMSTTGTNLAMIDIGSLGFYRGDRYQVRDSQNYFEVISSGVYTGNPIGISLILTNISAIPGYGQWTNRHSNVVEPATFNAFVLTRIDSRMNVQHIAVEHLNINSQ